MQLYSQWRLVSAVGSELHRCATQLPLVLRGAGQTPLNLGEHADGSSPVGRVRRGGRIHGSFFGASDPPCLVNRCRGDAASDWSRLLSVLGSAEAVTDLGVLKDGLVRGPPGVFVPPLYMARKSCSDDVNLDPERLGDLGTRPFPARR